jgi:hypothetical protein
MIREDVGTGSRFALCWNFSRISNMFSCYGYSDKPLHGPPLLCLLFSYGDTEFVILVPPLFTNYLVFISLHSSCIVILKKYCLWIHTDFK